MKLVKDWLMDVFDPTDQPWFREESTRGTSRGYMPETPETARPPRRPSAALRAEGARVITAL